MKVLTAFTYEDAYTLTGLIDDISKRQSIDFPIVAMCLGEKGKLSRVLNQR